MSYTRGEITMKKERFNAIPGPCKALAFMMFLLFAACTKQNIPEQQSGQIVQHTQPEPENTADLEDTAAAEQVSADEYPRKDRSVGVIYTSQAGLYLQNDVGQMKWQSEAVLGDTAVYLGTKKAAVRADGQKRTFFHIELKGKEYWIQDYCYEPDTVPAFVSAQNTVLYKSNTLTGATDEIIPQFFIVAVDKESLEQNDKFVKIAAYCPELSSAWVVKNKYIKRDAIELDSLSVEAMLLAHIASESRNDTIRAELYRNAIELNSAYTDTIAELQNLTEVIIAEEAYLKTLQVEKINKKMQLAADVNMLSVPASPDARIVHTAAADTAVTATKKTIIGESGVWYFVQSGQKKGWIDESVFKNIDQ